MNKNTGYTEQEGKAVIPDQRFKHVMALALDPRSHYKKGIIRCITSRDGNVQEYGYIDRSVLHKIETNTDCTFQIGEELHIENMTPIVEGLRNNAPGDGWDFLGIEDPDIWIDEKNNLVHLYFTMPLVNKKLHRNLIYLGHAVGSDIDSLKMTEPALVAKYGPQKNEGGKEVSIAPQNSKGFRYNLVESGDLRLDFHYSVVSTVIAKDMGKPWEYGEIVFHPADHKIPWIGGHASPGPLLPKSFIDIGENKLLGIMNGREANTRVDGKIIYGMFSIGLFIYDYEVGKIDWVSPQPFIRDSEAVTITFASQFVDNGQGMGTLYAHVDDSFVRRYTLDANAIKSLLPISSPK